MTTPYRDPDKAALAIVAVAALALVLCACLIALGGDDLPVEPPKFRGASKGPGVPGPPPEPPVEEDDPRDVPAPLFWGEEIDEARERIVYVLDRSGSMTAGFGSSWAVKRDSTRKLVAWRVGNELGGNVGAPGSWSAGSRWNRAQVETINSVQGLAASIEFEVLVYSTATYGCFGQAVAATPTNKGRAQAWILKWFPGGGTCTAPAVAAGLRLLPDAAVLLTDGRPECGSPDAIGDHRAAIRRANPRRTPVRVFGIGVDPVARAFCQGVASDSGGTYTEPR